MTFDELYEKILEILPGAGFEKDNYGQFLIYTNLVEDENGNMQDMDA